jgi:hypothetical protein
MAGLPCQQDSPGKDAGQHVGPGQDREDTHAWKSALQD